MRFDAADLALIETSLDVLEEPARGIIEELLAMVRELLAMVRELQEDRMNAEALKDELEGERSKRAKQASGRRGDGRGSATRSRPPRESHRESRGGSRARARGCVEAVSTLQRTQVCHCSHDKATHFEGKHTCLGMLCECSRYVHEDEPKPAPVKARVAVTPPPCAPYCTCPDCRPFGYP